MVKKINLIFLILMITPLFSCNRILYRGVNNLRNLPPSDFSYVIQPEFKESKESAEYKLNELFSTEEFNIKTYGNHRYDEETQKQIDERMWLHTTLLNSKRILNYQNEEYAIKLAREVAELVLKEINNASDYSKIQITFSKKPKHTNEHIEKKKVYLTVPELNETDFAN